MESVDEYDMSDYRMIKSCQADNFPSQMMTMGKKLRLNNNNNNDDYSGQSGGIGGSPGSVVVANRDTPMWSLNLLGSGMIPSGSGSSGYMNALMSGGGGGVAPPPPPVGGGGASFKIREIDQQVYMFLIEQDNSLPSSSSSSLRIFLEGCNNNIEYILVLYINLKTPTSTSINSTGSNTSSGKKKIVLDDFNCHIKVYVSD